MIYEDMFIEFNVMTSMNKHHLEIKQTHKKPSSSTICPILNSTTMRRPKNKKRREKQKRMGILRGWFVGGEERAEIPVDCEMFLTLGMESAIQFHDIDINICVNM